MSAIRWTYRNSCCVSMLACCFKIDGGGLVGDPVSAPSASPAQWIHAHSTTCAFCFGFVCEPQNSVRSVFGWSRCCYLWGDGKRHMGWIFTMFITWVETSPKKEPNRRESVRLEILSAKSWVLSLRKGQPAPSCWSLPSTCADVYVISI